MFVFTTNPYLFELSIISSQFILYKKRFEEMKNINNNIKNETFSNRNNNRYQHVLGTFPENHNILNKILSCLFRSITLLPVLYV